MPILYKFYKDGIYNKDVEHNTKLEQSFVHTLRTFLLVGFGLRRKWTQGKVRNFRDSDLNFIFWSIFFFFFHQLFKRNLDISSIFNFLGLSGHSALSECWWRGGGGICWQVVGFPDERFCFGAFHDLSDLPMKITRRIDRSSRRSLLIKGFHFMI